jgi:hypothetical protein
MMRRIGWGVVAVAATVASWTGGAEVGGTALAATAPGSAAAARTPTAVTVNRPVDSKGHLRAGFRVSRTFHHGGCEAGSDAIGDAYRCFAGNFVIDPCWVTAKPTVVDCQLEPWQHSVVRIHVTKGFTGGALGSGSRLPWGVRTTADLRCAFLQGASSAVHGRRVNYGCEDGKTFLVGSPDTSRPVWRIRAATLTTSGRLRATGWTDLSRAWFGKRSARATTS